MNSHLAVVDIGCHLRRAIDISLEATLPPDHLPAVAPAQYRADSIPQYCDDYVIGSIT